MEKKEVVNFSPRSASLVKTYTGGNKEERTSLIRANRTNYNHRDLLVNFKEDMRFTGTINRAEKNIEIIRKILDDFCNNRSTLLMFSGFAEGSQQTFFATNNIYFNIKCEAKDIFGKKLLSSDSKNSLSEHENEKEILTTSNNLKVKEIFLSEKGGRINLTRQDKKLIELLEFLNNKENSKEEKENCYKEMFNANKGSVLVVHGELTPNEEKFKEFFSDLKRPEMKKIETIPEKQSDKNFDWFKLRKTNTNQEKKAEKDLWIFKDGRTRNS